MIFIMNHDFHIKRDSKERLGTMAFANEEHRKQEKINGIVYDMSPSPGFRHGIVNGNIFASVKAGLKNSLCLAFMENLDFMYHPEENDDYLVPDIMIVCDRSQLKGGGYRGIPKFIAETLSPSTAKKDKTEKKDIYENAGVREYWIVSPQGSLEIYYLENERYVLAESYPEPNTYSLPKYVPLFAFHSSCFLLLI